MLKLLKFTCYLCLLLLCAGCGLGVKRAPGGVPKPAVKTLGMVKFTIPLTRQGSDRDDQFALWLEDPRTGTHFKTLAVTTYVATEGFKKDPGILPVWEQHSGIAFMTGAQQKDVNAIAIPVKQGGGMLPMAINCGGPAFNLSPDFLLDKIRPKLLELGRKLATQGWK